MKWMTNQIYNVLKWIATYFLPAMGTLYFALSQIWGLPYGEEIVGTITAIDTFLGVILGISSTKYKGEGTIFVTDDDTLAVELNDSPAENLAGGTINLTVQPGTDLTKYRSADNRE